MIDAFSCRCKCNITFPYTAIRTVDARYVNLQLPPYGSSVALKSLPESMSHRAEWDRIYRIYCPIPPLTLLSYTTRNFKMWQQISALGQQRFPSGNLCITYTLSSTTFKRENKFTILLHSIQKNTQTSGASHKTHTYYQAFYLNLQNIKP